MRSLCSLPSLLLFGFWCLLYVLWLCGLKGKKKQTLGSHLAEGKGEKTMALNEFWSCEITLTSSALSCSCRAASRVLALMRKSLEVLSFMYCIRFTWTTTNVSETLCECSNRWYSTDGVKGAFCVFFDLYKSLSVTYLRFFGERDEIFFVLLDAED